MYIHKSNKLNKSNKLISILIKFLFNKFYFDYIIHKKWYFISCIYQIIKSQTPKSNTSKVH